jgi:hypothetical protein
MHMCTMICDYAMESMDEYIDARNGGLLANSGGSTMKVLGSWCICAVGIYECMYEIRWEKRSGTIQVAHATSCFLS